MRILVIIPARGGSKGIPRKNIRKLAGNPLLFYSVRTALSSKYKPDVYVSSEDEEILELARQLGANCHKRNPSLADDRSTLDPVIYEAYAAICEKKKVRYDLVITMQATSPLLTVNSLDTAISLIVKNKQIDTIIAAKEDTHLSWRKEADRFLPNYRERVNRQYLQPNFRETGAFLITRTKFVTEKGRIGNTVHLFLLNDGESIDIDSAGDWNLCEYYLRKKKILFVISGYKEIGLGHVYNALSIANEILNHELVFLVDKKSQLAFDKIKEHNYEVYRQKSADIQKDIILHQPDIIINDRLDTTAAYVRNLKKQGLAVINFEDMGPGAAYADVVINAMYPEKKIRPKHYFGHPYFCLKDEFLYQDAKPQTRRAGNLVLAFGGVDPNNYTLKVLDSVYAYCSENGIKIFVIVGMGYKKAASLKKFSGIEIHRDVKNMAALLAKADMAFTSAGRTTFEVASLGIPTIVLAQNERELTHFFCKKENGFINMGLGVRVSKKEIRAGFVKLANDFTLRKQMRERMLKSNLLSGKSRVMKLIYDTINNHTA